MYRLWHEAPQTLVLEVHGKLSEKDVLDLIDDVERYTAAATPPKVILVDLTRARPSSLHVRIHLVSLMRNTRVRAGAFFGTSHATQMMLTVTLKAAGAVDHACFFEGEDAARAWLAQQRQSIKPD
jgi:hypothetical protein